MPRTKGRLARLAHRFLAPALLIAIVWPLPLQAGGATEQTIVELIHARLSLMDEVAAYKLLNDVPIEDQEREAVVLAHAVEAAEDVGLDGATTVAFFSAQIEAAKAIQVCWMERWRQGESPVPEGAPDLAGVIRPQLIEIGDALIATIARHAGETGGIDAGTLPAIDCLPPDKADTITSSLSAVAPATP
ncbi:MAG: gamma subclass chorismate mutase AroQ [Pseudomonadota bacterium]